MGRYIPPELEGTTSGNKLHRRRAPGTLKKDGSQTVRFEMPFAVWCHTCEPHAIIGQGVRFNAEKKKVGHYHSTPIWSFRMRHAACNGTLEIRTDPKNTAYVVVEGGKARDYGDSEDRIREGEGGMPILTAEEREQRREDAFAQLEGKIEDKQQKLDHTKRIAELHSARSRDWDDPWAANKRVRQAFRAERKDLQRKEAADEAIKDRIGTDIILLPERVEDSQHAKLISFGDTGDQSTASLKPIFRQSKPKIVKSTSSASTANDRKRALQRQLLSNTRSSLNPFG